MSIGFDLITDKQEHHKDDGIQDWDILSTFPYKETEGVKYGKDRKGLSIYNKEEDYNQSDKERVHR